MVTADPGELADYTPPEEMELPSEGFLLDDGAVVEGAVSESIIMDRHLALYHVGPPVQAADLEALWERVTNELASLNTYSEGAREAIVSMLEVEVVSLRGDVGTMVASLADRISALQSEMTAQVEVQTALEAEVGPGGFLGFVQSVAGFALSPLESLLEKVGEYILGEVEDGLNS